MTATEGRRAEEIIVGDVVDMVGPVLEIAEAQGMVVLSCEKPCKGLSIVRVLPMARILCEVRP